MPVDLLFVAKNENKKSETIKLSHFIIQIDALETNFRILFKILIWKFAKNLHHKYHFYRKFWQETKGGPLCKKLYFLVKIQIQLLDVLDMLEGWNLWKFDGKSNRWAPRVEFLPDSQFFVEFGKSTISTKRGKNWTHFIKWHFELHPE